jgi:anti-anti-sigma factor
MNETSKPSRIMVIRPRAQVRSGQIDVLYLDDESNEQLVLRHPLESGSGPWFKEIHPKIQNVLGSVISLVLLDLSEVFWLNSASLGDMVDLHKQIETSAGKLAMVNPSPRVKSIFDVTQLDRYFEVFDSLERGITYLRTGKKPGGI